MRNYIEVFCVRAFATVLIVAAVTCQAIGQKSKLDSVTLYSPKQLDSLVNVKVTPERASRLLGKSQDGGSYFLITRTKPGDVEVHEQWDDVAIVRAGHGILKTGTKLTGQKENGKAPAREWVGGTIQDGKERKLAPGDFIVIPAMLPHQYIPDAGETFQYWTIKVKHIPQ